MLRYQSFFAGGVFEETMHVIPRAALTATLAVLCACGGGGSSAPTSSSQPINTIPSALADNFTVDENSEVTGEVGLNDSGLVDLPVIYSLDISTASGSLTFHGNGTFSYTPTRNFYGTDNFTYSVSDANGDISSAMASITVIERPDYIAGQIVDANSFTGQSVAGATVTLLFNNQIALSDNEGRYHFDITGTLPIPETFLALSISADGYRPRELNVELNNENSIVELTAHNDYNYFRPVQLDDGLLTAELGEKNINSVLINQLMQKVVQQNENLGYRQVHSLLVYKDGALVLEEYNIGNDDFIRFEDNIARDSSRPDKQWARNEKHYIASVNKALTSTVAGIAMDAYSIQVEDKISIMLPDKASFFSDTNKAALSIHQMLTMQLGFTWDEWSSNDLALLWKSDDFTEFLLSRANAGPGSAWIYNSASPNMLLRALDNTVQDGIRDWAHTNFYSKLGITDYDWVSQPDGIPEGAARMHMRPRDLLKIGVAYLDNGVWNNQQVIPASWVAEISKVQVAGFAGDYSYFFWHRTINGVPYISADGDGGQYINIFPDQNMVIVMTQGNYLEWPLYVNQADDIMGNYILPSLAN